MALPSSIRRTVDVELSGGVVTIRPLTFDEVRELGKGETNAKAVAWSTGSELAEARAWLAEVDYVDADKLTEAIMELNGLGKGAQKSAGQTDVPGDARSAE